MNCPTVCVTCVWAGVDSAWEQEKLKARKMLENAAESHTSGARFVGTLFDLEDSLPFHFTLAKTELLCKISLLRLGCPPHPRRSIFIRVGQILALFALSNHAHFLNNMNLAGFVNHRRIDWLGYQHLYHLPSKHGLQVKHYEFLILYT
jgi:hypothetical protein